MTSRCASREISWPAALQTAIEAKERVALKTHGRILGSIAVQSLIALYPQICGMTGSGHPSRGV